MDQPDSEAVGIRTEVDKTFLSYLTAQGAGDRLWRRDGAALHVATITQGTTAELSKFMSTLPTRSLCRQWISRIGHPSWILPGRNGIRSAQGVYAVRFDRHEVKRNCECH